MNKLIETISRYIETRIELIKVDLQQNIANSLVKAVQLGITIFLAFFIVSFVSIGLANLFNDLTDSPFWGYFIMAGFYLLLFLIARASQGVIQNKMEQVTGNMFKAQTDVPEGVEETAKEVMDQNESLGSPSARVYANDDLNRPSTSAI